MDMLIEDMFAMSKATSVRQTYTSMSFMVAVRENFGLVVEVTRLAKLARQKDLGAAKYRQ